MKITIEGTQEEIKQFMIDYAKEKMTLNIDELPKCSHELPKFSYDPHEIPPLLNQPNGQSICCHDKSLYKQYEQKVQK